MISQLNANMNRTLPKRSEEDLLPAQTELPAPQDLPAYLRKVLPDPGSISEVEVREGINAVVFRWHGVQFLVDPTLRTLELRDRKLYISNLSTLLQAILQRRRKKELLLAGAIEQLHEAERLIWTRNATRQSIDLVDEVKEKLEREISA